MSNPLQRLVRFMELIQMMLWLTLLIAPLVAVGTRVPDWPYRISHQIALPLGTALLVLLLMAFNMSICRALSRFRK